MSKHTPGPWAIQRPLDKIVVATSNGVAAEVKFNNREANAARIVECVNALEGVENPARAIELAREQLEFLLIAADKRGLTALVKGAQEALAALGVK